MNSTIAAVVWPGCSSITQWPEFANDAGRHIGRDKAHNVAHLCAERMVSTKRQHWHGELALRRKRLVVGEHPD